MFKEPKGENEEAFVPLSPVNFFQLVVDCPHVNGNHLPDTNKKEGKAFLLPNTTALCSEEHFADVAMGWNREGLIFDINVLHPFQNVSFPEITEGDSIELFIDTRDIKTSGFNTRFCHHFFFLPEAMSGHQAGEITRFRTEDAHAHCDPHDLVVKAHIKSNSYNLQIFIPSQCLHGYDPDQSDRIGFTYRINRPDGPPQHFSAVSEEYQIEQQPSLWSSVKLVK